MVRFARLSVCPPICLFAWFHSSETVYLGLWWTLVGSFIWWKSNPGQCGISSLCVVYIAGAQSQEVVVVSQACRRRSDERCRRRHGHQRCSYRRLVLPRQHRQDRTGMMPMPCSVSFYSRDASASMGTRQWPCVSLCLCLSVRSGCSIETDRHANWFCDGGFFRPVLHCIVRKLWYLQNKCTSSPKLWT